MFGYTYFLRMYGYGNILGTGIAIMCPGFHHAGLFVYRPAWVGNKKYPDQSGTSNRGISYVLTSR